MLKDVVFSIQCIHLQFAVITRVSQLINVGVCTEGRESVPAMWDVRQARVYLFGIETLSCRPFVPVSVSTPYPRPP